MSEKPTIEHAFTVNLRDGKGQAMIFVKHVAPSCIQSVQRGEHGGADLSLRSGPGETLTVGVTQTVDEINSCIAECKRLDAEERGKKA